jgi:hypothetical protein
MTTQRGRIGRPAEIPNRVTLAVYLAAQERRALVRSARWAQMSASAWVRRLILEALAVRSHP